MGRSNIIGIAAGVFLLLCCRGILNFSMLWKLLVPAIVVIIGLKMVFTGLFGNKANEIIAKIKRDDGESVSELNRSGDGENSIDIVGGIGVVDLKFISGARTD